MKSQITVTISANDLEKLKLFYTNLFDCKVIMENDKIIILQFRQILLSICTKALFKEYTGIKEVSANSGFYFTVNFDSVSEVDAQFLKFKTNGIKLLKEPKKVFWGGYSGFIADPEENLLEISFNPYPYNIKG